jgi:hypothetical protein
MRARNPRQGRGVGSRPRRNAIDQGHDLSGNEPVRGRYQAALDGADVAFAPRPRRLPGPAHRAVMQLEDVFGADVPAGTAAAGFRRIDEPRCVGVVRDGLVDRKRAVPEGDPPRARSAAPAVRSRMNPARATEDKTSSRWSAALAARRPAVVRAAASVAASSRMCRVSCSTRRSAGRGSWSKHRTPGLNASPATRTGPLAFPEVHVGVGGAAFHGCNEALVLSRPELIRHVHEAYLAAGADVSRPTPSRLAAQARRVRPGRPGRRDQPRRRALARVPPTGSTPDRPRFVAGAMGPTGMLISSSDPALSKITFDELARSTRAGAASRRGRRRSAAARDEPRSAGDEGRDRRDRARVRARFAARADSSASDARRDRPHAARHRHPRGARRSTRCRST